MTLASWAFALSLVALAGAVAALVLANLAFRRSRQRPRLTPATRASVSTAPSAALGEAAQVWVIMNPTKVPDTAALTAQVTTAALAAGLGHPRFVSTTAADPGVGQARQAVEAGARLVLIAGGDGTVRLVCGVLAGTDIPVGIVPMGTGNLLARNLDLPIDDLTQACRIALTGHDSALDIGWLRLDESAERHPFLVIAGVGFDAEMMAGASADWKSKLGWGAYVISGVRALRTPPMDITLSYPHAEAPTSLRARTLMFASCGELTGGLTLVPGADPSDGWMEITAIDVRGGLVGWGELGAHVVARAVGVRNRLSPVTSTLTTERATEASAVIDGEACRVQVDGDTLGMARRLDVRLQRHALVVRTR